jgi:hypothetical protein
MTTTINCQDNSDNNCIVAKTTLEPECFKLRLGYNPANVGISGATVYELSLCSPAVIFTDSCCLAGAQSVILRIPLMFSQNCSLYRINVTTSTSEIFTAFTSAQPTIATVYMVVDNDISTAVADSVFYYEADGYLCIIIPTSHILLTPTNGNLVATIVFASFNIPLIKIADFVGGFPLFGGINWIIGTTDPPSVSTTVPTTNVSTTSVAPTTAAPTTAAPTTAAPTTAAPTTAAPTTTIAPTTIPPTTTFIPPTTIFIPLP